jgi:hypothetical protein
VAARRSEGDPQKVFEVEIIDQGADRRQFSFTGTDHEAFELRSATQ